MVGLDSAGARRELDAMRDHVHGLRRIDWFGNWCLADVLELSIFQLIKLLWISLKNICAYLKSTGV